MTNRLTDFDDGEIRAEPRVEGQLSETGREAVAAFLDRYFRSLKIDDGNLLRRLSADAAARFERAIGQPVPAHRKWAALSEAADAALAEQYAGDSSRMDVSAARLAAAMGDLPVPMADGKDGGLPAPALLPAAEWTPMLRQHLQPLLRRRPASRRVPSRGAAPALVPATGRAKR